MKSKSNLKIIPTIKIIPYNLHSATIFLFPKEKAKTMSNARNPNMIPQLKSTSKLFTANSKNKIILFNIGCSSANNTESSKGINFPIFYFSFVLNAFPIEPAIDPANILTIEPMKKETIISTPKKNKNITNATVERIAPIICENNPVNVMITMAFKINNTKKIIAGDNIVKATIFPIKLDQLSFLIAQKNKNNVN